MRLSSAQPSLTLFPSRAPDESLAALRSLTRIPFLAVIEHATISLVALLLDNCLVVATFSKDPVVAGNCKCSFQCILPQLGFCEC
jgi:hypothetical protein